MAPYQPTKNEDEAVRWAIRNAPKLAEGVQDAIAYRDELEAEGGRNGRFDEALQDRLAIASADIRRCYQACVASWARGYSVAGN